MDKPLKSVTHGQCDARPTVTFPANLYCLVTEAHVCEKWPESNSRPTELQDQHPTTYYYYYYYYYYYNFYYIRLTTFLQDNLSKPAPEK